jgi:opacity protein-like surface antigen
MKRFLILAFAAGALFAFAHPCVAGPFDPPAMRNWRVGLGFGLGSAKINETGGGTFEARDGISPRYNLQYRVSKRLLLGVCDEAWLTERGGTDSLRIRRSMHNYNVIGTYYPGSLTNAWSTFYLRGGIGLGLGRYNEVIPDEKGEDAAEHATDMSGLGGHIGVGYDVSMTPTVTFGVLATQDWVSLGGPLWDDGWYRQLSVNLGWSF